MISFGLWLFQESFSSYQIPMLDFGYVHLAFEGNHNPKDLQDPFTVFFQVCLYSLLNTIQMYRGNQQIENQKRRKVRVSKGCFLAILWHKSSLSKFGSKFQLEFK